MRLAIVSEIIPAAKRGRYMAILEGLLAAGLHHRRPDEPSAPLLVRLARGIPLVRRSRRSSCFVIRLYVPESPRWLAERGRHEEAGLLMAKIERPSVAGLGGRELPPAVTAPARGRRPSAASRFSSSGPAPTSAAP